MPEVSGLSNYAAVSPQIAEYVRTTADVLASAFGLHFDFWVVGDDTVIPVMPPGEAGNAVPLPPVDHWPHAACPERVAAPDLAVFLRQAEDPLVRQTEANRVWVGLPLGEVAGWPLLATTVFEAMPADAVRLLAQVVWDDLRLRQELERYRADLDVCAAQIGNDFEELTFLRTLADHLDVSDPSHGTWHVAQMVLPLLASVIRAESLVLVSAERDEPSGQVRVGRPVIWVGPRRLDDQACQRFIERFRQAAAGQPVVRNRFHEAPEGREFPGVRKFVLTSLAKGDCVRGWLAAINHVRRPAGSQEPLLALSQYEFGTVEASLLSSVASMLATHVRNVELFREKEAILVGVVRAMVSAIDAKDPYTCGHSERVALVARRIAQEMGLDEEACEQIYLSGLMHDLGKLGVADAVLRKNGPLTEEEWNQIRPHPERGWAILQGVEQLGYLIPGVLHHHEQYDGRGYPDGLAGDAIPLSARILAVADAYDAMVSDRPYRKGMPQERVERILREGAGSQWDPAVVDAFFRALEDIRRIWTGYQPPPPPRRTPSPNGRRSSGFSIVELVIAVLVLGILAAAAVPRFADALARQRVEAAARRVVADLEWARREASFHAAKQTVSFRAGSHRYCIAPGPKNLDRRSRPYVVSLADAPYEVHLASAEAGGDSDVVFDPGGAPDSAATIVLEAGVYRATVTLSADTMPATYQIGPKPAGG